MTFSGVFAAGLKTIPANTFVGLYAGELITTDEAEERGQSVPYTRLS